MHLILFLTVHQIVVGISHNIQDGRFTGRVDSTTCRERWQDFHGCVGQVVGERSPADCWDCQEFAGVRKCNLDDHRFE